VNSVIGAVDTDFQAVVATADGGVTGGVPLGYGSELTGNVSDGAFEGSWTVEDTYGTWSFPLAGTVTDTTFYATGETTFWGYPGTVVTLDGAAD